MLHALGVGETVGTDTSAENRSASQSKAPNYIESIFPMNVAPWNHPGDPRLLNQYNKPPLFRFDFGSSLVPWRLRILFGFHSYGLHSARRLTWQDIGYDKLNRKSVWRKFGQTLHFLTLEFSDVSLEKGYQLDYASRSHQYVQLSGIFVAIISAIVIGKSIQDNERQENCGLGETIMSSTLFYVMLLGFLRSIISLSFRNSHLFSKWIISNFQLFQSIWAGIALITCLSLFYFNPFPDCVIKGEEAGTFSVLVVLIAVFFRLRFIYLLFIILSGIAFVLTARWFSNSSGVNGFMDIVLMVAAAVGSLGAVYLVEVLLRKDFVQSLAVTTESQRSDRLLRNVLPKRIIDTLKRRQDAGGLPNASVGATVGPGATALFTRTAGAASRYLFNKGNGGLMNSAANNMSRFDSRIGSSALASNALAEAFDSVTILFADVVGFTKISSRVSPEQLVLLLNELFTVFDNLAESNGLEKIKTIGDAYMAAAGIPSPHPLHAHAAARMALQMIEAMDMFCDDLGEPLQLRIGIHSGSAVAGVIGRRKFIYDVWGDSVNTASRMESHGEAMRVHCSQQTAEKIQLDFDLEFRGELEIKGKGRMATYFVLRELPHSKYRSVLPTDISQWRDRFSSGRGSLATDSDKRRGSYRSSGFDDLSPTDDENDLNDEEVF